MFGKELEEYIFRKYGLHSREELAEDIVELQKLTVRYRPDEGSTNIDLYKHYRERCQELEKVAEEIGLTYLEIREAQERIEQGAPIGLYGGKNNIFIKFVERLSRNLNSFHGPHVRYAVECIEEWAQYFRDRSEIPINDRIRMMLNSESIITKWRNKVTFMYNSFYCLFQAVLDTVCSLPEVDQVNIELNDLENLLDFLYGNSGWRNNRNLEFENIQFENIRCRQVMANIEEFLSKAEKLRTFDAFESARAAIEEAIPHGRAHLREKVQLIQHLVEPTQRFIKLALVCGSEYQEKGDLDVFIR